MSPREQGYQEDAWNLTGKDGQKDHVGKRLEQEESDIDQYGHAIAFYDWSSDQDKVTI